MFACTCCMILLMMEYHNVHSVPSVVPYHGWAIMKPLLESMHTISYFRLDTLSHSNMKMDTVSLLHLLYVYNDVCTLHCYNYRVVKCYHLHTTMPRYT